MMDIWLTIFLTFVVSHKVQSQLRLVVNTTCLELAKPSNQQFRLSCRQHAYHCLLDETFTKEFEVCRDWKWIPEGNCAYFNSYYNGNIDGRPCISTANIICPNMQYSSADTTKYSSCYMQKNTSTMGSTTSSYRRHSTSFPFSKTTHKKSNGTWMGIHINVYIAIAVGVIILSLSIAVMCFRYKRVTNGKKGTNSSGEKSDDRDAERQLLTCAKNDKLKDLPTDGNKLKENSADPSNKSLDSKKSENDVDIEEPHQCQKSSDKISDQTVIICNEKEDDEQSTDVFEKNVVSLQMKASTTDKQSTKLCLELYNLLCQEGLKTSQEVMEAIITRITGKSVQELVADEAVVNTLAEILPDDFYPPITNVKCQNSFILSHSLLRIYLDEKYHPKSGWGNPVVKEDIGIGDDVERLYKIHSNVCKIVDPVTESVESYIRLLDTMIEALMRLDHDAECEEGYTLLVRKLKSITKPNLTQTMFKQITSFFQIW